MRYCPDCGVPHECAAQAAADKSEVTITRIQAERDIEIARINANATTVVAEVTAADSAEHAEGVAEGMETALDAVAGGGSDAAAEGEPIIVDTDGLDAEPAPEPTADAEPPIVEIPEPKSSGGGGYWDSYR